MSGDWPKANLADVATVIGRGIAPKYTDDGQVVVVNQRCVRDHRLSFDQARRHDPDIRSVPAAKLLRVGDILVNSTGVGTLGRTAPVSVLAEPTTADSHLTIIRPGQDLDPGWLRYAMAAAEPAIEAMAEGSTGQTELSRHRLALLEVTLPPQADQRAIGTTLGILDEKIESNRRQRGLLRKLGAAQFAAAIANDGVERRLQSVTTSIARGVGPKYADDDFSAPLVLNQKCIRDGWVSLVPARRMQGRAVAPAKKASNGDILVNSTGVGTLGRVARWHEGSIFVDSHVSVVKPDVMEVGPTVLAYAMLGRVPDIEVLGEGSTGQTELSPTRLGEFEVRLPDAAKMTVLEDDLLAIERRADHLAAENDRLASLRDALLPELLSGRIRVSLEEVA